MRPASWDAYQWRGHARCKRCKEILVGEFLLPGGVAALIPPDKLREAMGRMGDFAKRYLEVTAQYHVGEPDWPLCEERKP